MNLIQRIYRLLLNLRQRTARLFSVIIACLAAIFGLNPSVNAATWFVDGSVVDCDNQGNSWTNAFKYLQDALNNLNLAEGDEIWVAAGTYYPDRDCANPDGSCDPGPCDRAASFHMISAVKVYGGFFGDELTLEERDIIANETILSGDLGIPDDNSDNSRHVVQFLGLADPAVLDGFTVRDANSLPDKFGGGIVVVSSDRATIRNCLIEENVAQTGGGLGATGNLLGDVLEVRNCRFVRNSAFHGGGIGFKFGPDPEVNVINCEFSLNDAILGGGLHAVGGKVTVVNAIFTENTASDNGGGTDFGGASEGLLINCLFASNTADDFGGAVYVAGSTTTADFVNCTLSANESNDRGGGIVGDFTSSTTITNCILWGNTDVAGSTDVEEAQLLMRNNASATVTYTCIQDDDPDDGDIPYGGQQNNNIDDDPNFGEPDTNYRLAADTSPCVDAGDNNAVDCDFYNVDEDELDCFSEPIEYTPDLDFRDRVVDGDEDMIATVDMGAYEFAQCPWDLDGNCSVGASDLLALLVAWGPNPGHPADFDNNGTVGATDLLSLLVNWGPCPCGDQSEPLTLEEELADACLTQEDWDEFEDVMKDPNSSQEDKDRYHCWMNHYLFHCNRCNCSHPSECPSPDPFG